MALPLSPRPRARLRVALCAAVFGCVNLISGAVTAIEAEPRGRICEPTVSLDALKNQKNLPDVDLIRTLNLDKGVTGLAWSPNGKLLATSENWDMVIKIWDATDFHVLHTVRKENDGNFQLLFTGDSRYLITTSQAPYNGVNRTTLSIIDVSSGAVVTNVAGPYDPANFAQADRPHKFTLSPDGTLLYVTYNTRDDVHVFSVSSWTDVGTFPASDMEIKGGPRDDELTILDAEQTVHVWSSSSHKFVRTFPVVDDSVFPQAMAVDAGTCRVAIADSVAAQIWDAIQKRFVTPPAPEPIRIWDLNTGDKLAGISASSTSHGLAFSPDSKSLVAALDDKTVVLFSSASPENRRTLYKFDAVAWFVAFSPDGHMLAIGGDHKVLIFAVK